MDCLFQLTQNDNNSESITMVYYSQLFYNYIFTQTYSYSKSHPQSHIHCVGSVFYLFLQLMVECRFKSLTRDGA